MCGDYRSTVDVFTWGFHKTPLGRWEGVEFRFGVALVTVSPISSSVRTKFGHVGVSVDSGLEHL
jgi:hypothetical protein